MRCTLAAVLLAAFVVFLPALAEEKAPRIDIKPNDAEGKLQVFIDGKESLTYVHGENVDLPHYYPVRSPSGQSLTAQQIDPFPHHRSVWFADSVRLAGQQRKVSFYNAWFSRANPKDPKSPFRDRIRHTEAKPGKSEGNQAEITLKLVWEMDRKTPVLDESRLMRIIALGQGEYLVDLKFTLTASYGDVEFDSDAVHYAWPFVRISPEFSPQKGGVLSNSEGGIGQAKTHNQTARWVDYSNTVAGQTEGLTVCSHPDNGPPPRWLTRDYGTFGPRRPDEKSGKKFTLKKGEQLTQRVGILVHRGDVKGGKVAERYQSYVDGKR